MFSNSNEIQLPEPYLVVDNTLCTSQTKGNKEYLKMLCNFVPYIVSEVSGFDRYERSTKVEIGGFDCNGNTLPKVIVSNEEFDKMNWIRENWGFSCNISPGQSVKDQIRHAIQCTSPNAVKKEIFETTGWHKLNGNYVFLMPGSSDFDVSLEGKLNSYGFDYRELSDKEYQDIFFMLGQAPSDVFQVLMAYAFLSPLNSFLREIQHEPKTVILLHGKTGSKKSTLAALFCSFFGKFSTTDLPLSFRDTANSIIYNTGILKDVLTVVDDFHPSSKHDENSMTDNMQKLLRAYGNRTGRGRLNSKALPTETRYPKGNAIFTAEFLPDVGESGTARYIPLELKSKSLNNDVLTFYQNYAMNGTLSTCMYQYTEWIKEKYLCDKSKFISLFGDKFSSIRANLNFQIDEKKIIIRDRLVDDLVCFRIGFEFMTDFFCDKNACSTDSKNAYIDYFNNIITGLAKIREEQTIGDQPTHKFICKLYALLESERVGLIDRTKTFNDYTPQNCIGYEDESCLYLHTSLAHKEVKRFCEEQGEAFTISEKALLKALAEEELIIRSADGRNTVQHNFGGKNKRYLVLFKEKAREIYDNTN